MQTIRKEIEGCLEKLRGGSLSEYDLQKVLDSIDQAGAAPPRQRLLYMYCRKNSVFSRALSTFLIAKGRKIVGTDVRGAAIQELAYEAEEGDPNTEILYCAVSEAMDDGWRVIKFPEATLAMDEQNTYGLGFEFILEQDHGTCKEMR